MKSFVKNLHSGSEEAEAEHGEVNTGTFPQLRQQHLQRTPKQQEQQNLDAYKID